MIAMIDITNTQTGGAWRYASASDAGIESSSRRISTGGILNAAGREGQPGTVPIGDGRGNTSRAGSDAS